LASSEHLVGKFVVTKCVRGLRSKT